MYRALLVILCWHLASPLFAADASFDGVQRTELFNRDTGGRVWVYLPPKPIARQIPIVVGPPAGSRLFHGMNLSAADLPEHLPYAKAGFAVISFDLAGAWPKQQTNPKIIQAITTYVERGAGLLDAEDAIAMAGERFPELNTDEIYLAGHSSAATVALVLARELANVRGVAAFAPVLDMADSLDKIAKIMGPHVPGFESVLMASSPDKHVQEYALPVFLFSADDDSALAAERPVYREFIAGFKRNNLNLTARTVSRGGHYDSMIDQGIPMAIDWLEGLHRDIRQGP